MERRRVVDSNHRGRNQTTDRLLILDIPQNAQQPVDAIGGKLLLH
jgi:hypothetical protein